MNPFRSEASAYRFLFLTIGSAAAVLSSPRPGGAWRPRLDASLGRLAAAGLDARGEIGDADPLQAIEDALRTFGADEIIISTHPEGRSNWLEKGIVGAARERFALPITHVVVDLEK